MVDKSDESKTNVVVSKPASHKNTAIKKVAGYIFVSLVLIGVGVALDRFVLKQDGQDSQPTITTLQVTNLCNLVSEQEVSSALKDTYKKSNVSSSFAAEIGNATSLGPCTFNTSESQDIVSIKSISFYALKYNNSGDAKSYFDSQFSQLENKEDLANIGQVAIWNKTYNQLVILNGKYVIYITPTSNMTSPQDASVALGALIADRIQNVQ